MKIHGKQVTSVYEEVVAIPRPGGAIVFKAQAISDFEPFDKLCPVPKPPQRMYPGGRTVDDIEDPSYKKQFNEWAEAKVHWMFLESLKATPGLQWETVDMSKHETWKNYQEELKESGFSPAEQARIIGIVSMANGLDQSKIDEATEAFLADQALQVSSENSLGSAPSDTPSGEPANAST